MTYFEILIFLIALFCVLGFLLYKKYSGQNGTEKALKPKGYYLGITISLSLPLGTLIGIAMGEIILGPGIGLLLGTAFGTLMEKRHADEHRPLSKELISNDNISVKLIGLGLISSIFLIFIFLSRQ